MSLASRPDLFTSARGSRMRSTRSRVVIVAMAAAMLLVPAAVAQAGALSYSGTFLQYSAFDPSETNNVTLSRGDGTLVLNDSTATITLSPYSGCQLSADQHTATCPLPNASSASVSISLGGQNDTFTSNITGSTPPPNSNGVFIFVSGGEGND